MRPSIFVDANVPIYAAGRDHDLREPCRQVLFAIEAWPERFVTDAEVLQELVHRYRALRTWDVGRAPVLDFADLMQNRIAALLDTDVRAMMALADRYVDLSARDLVHVAVMGRLGVGNVVSADRDFDRVAGLTRLDPRDLPTWRSSLPA